VGNVFHFCFSLMLAVAGYAQSMVSTQAVTPLFTLWICVYEAGK